MMCVIVVAIIVVMAGVFIQITFVRDTFNARGVPLEIRVLQFLSLVLAEGLKDFGRGQFPKPCPCLLSQTIQCLEFSTTGIQKGVFAIFAMLLMLLKGSKSQQGMTVVHIRMRHGRGSQMLNIKRGKIFSPFRHPIFVRIHYGHTKGLGLLAQVLIGMLQLTGCQRIQRIRLTDSR